MDHPQLTSITKVLIANRGEIAVRCIHATRDLGLTSVAIYTPSDATSLHVALADEAVQLSGDGTSGYLDMYVHLLRSPLNIYDICSVLILTLWGRDDILRICCECSADAVIPGYGFLSENAAFARKVIDAGITSWAHRLSLLRIWA